MFSKLIPTSFFLLLLCFSAVYYFQIRTQPLDRSDYFTVLDEAKSFQLRKKIKRESASQVRQNVQKDIWTRQDQERLHFRLKSERSNLLIGQKSKSFSGVEYLHGIECDAQEEIDRLNNTQEIRVLLADSGTYHFPEHRFLADEVDLFFFHIAGTTLPPTIPFGESYLRGKAKNVAFAAENKSLQFSAYHLKAELDPKQAIP